MSILSSVALGFFGRKIIDVGGWVGGVAMAAFGFYAAASPAQQQMIGNILHGKWQDITLGALVPFIIWGFGQVMSYRATVKPQVVTPLGQKIELEKLSTSDQREVVATAVAAPRARTLVEMLAEKLGKR